MRAEATFAEPDDYPVEIVLRGNLREFEGLRKILGEARGEFHKVSELIGKIDEVSRALRAKVRSAPPEAD